jgi:hypothetical protein
MDDRRALTESSLTFITEGGINLWWDPFSGSNPGTNPGSNPATNPVIVVSVRQETSRDKSRKRLSLAIYEDDEILTILKVFLNNKDIHGSFD